MTDGLKDAHREAIIAVIAANDRVERAVLFGSRATGTNTVTSDVDIALFGDRLTLTHRARLTAALEEIPMAQTVDLLLYDSIQDRALREHIRNDGVEWFERPQTRRGWLFHPEFPKHWRSRPLYSMATWVNGLAFKRIQFSDTGRPVIKIAEIKGGISGQTRFTQQTFDDSVFVRPGDLLFSWSGQPETSIDAFWWRGPEGWLNQHIFRVTPEAGLDATFFYYLLRYLKPNFVGIARNKQTTGLGHVTKRDLENLEVAYPALSEQRAIAHILGTLDDKIELNRRMNETLEAMARTLFKSWFVDFDPVRAKMEGWDTGLPQDVADLLSDRLVDSEMGEIPEGWEVAPLGELLEVNPKRSLRRGQIAPYLPMKEMPTRGHVPDSVAVRPFGSGMRFVNGDTLVARITPCLENGKTAYVDFLRDDEVGWGSTEYIVLKPRPPLPNQFAYCLARGAGFREFAIQNMSGTSGRQRVPVAAVKGFLVVAPPVGLAAQFGKVAALLFHRANSAARESRTLAALRDALLSKLISGELRVHETSNLAEAVA